MTATNQRTGSGLGLAIATVVVIIATIAVNTISNFFPPGGLNTGEVANTILGGLRILPANFAFAIWGLIYLGLLAYGYYQFQPAQRENPTIQRVDLCLIVASIAQIIWIFLFSYRQFWLSVIAMLGILIPLIVAYTQLNIGRERAGRERKWFANIPFSVYLAWISVATIINIAGALSMSGWDGGNPEMWTALMLVIGTVIAVIAILQRSDVAFPLVFVWAYGAIAIRQFDRPLVWITAAVGAIVLVALLVLQRSRNQAQWTGDNQPLNQ